MLLAMVNKNYNLQCQLILMFLKHLYFLYYINMIYACIIIKLKVLIR